MMKAMTKAPIAMLAQAIKNANAGQFNDASGVIPDKLSRNLWHIEAVEWAPSTASNATD